MIASKNIDIPSKEVNQPTLDLVSTTRSLDGEVRFHDNHVENDSQVDRIAERSPSGRRRRDGVSDVVAGCRPSTG
jgi:hypothetical protein